MWKKKLQVYVKAISNKVKEKEFSPAISNELDILALLLISLWRYYNCKSVDYSEEALRIPE